MQAKIPRKSPKKVWLKETLEYDALLLAKSPIEADEKIRNPPITRTKMEIKKGMSTFILFMEFVRG